MATATDLQPRGTSIIIGPTTSIDMPTMKNNKHENADSALSTAPGSQSFFYHGSPCEINDVALASGTWLTDDIDLSREYGEFVYRVEVPEEHKSVIEGPNWEGHFVTRGHIPMGYLNLIENAEVRNRANDVFEM